jgi:hypothetical protein
LTNQEASTFGKGSVLNLIATGIALCGFKLSQMIQGWDTPGMLILLELWLMFTNIRKFHRSQTTKQFCSIDTGIHFLRLALKNSTSENLSESLEDCLNS